MTFGSLVLLMSFSIVIRNKYLNYVYYPVMAAGIVLVIIGFLLYGLKFLLLPFTNIDTGIDLGIVFIKSSFLKGVILVIDIMLIYKLFTSVR